MVIIALNTEYVGPEEDTPVNKGPSKEDLAKVQLIEQYIAIANSYLKAIDASYKRIAEQDRQNERAIRAKKSNTKAAAQAQMEDFAQTNKGRASGNSYVAKESSSDVSSSISDGSNNTGPSIATGPSYA